MVDLGTELTPTETHEIPEIHYKHEGGVLYTLVMTGMNFESVHVITSEKIF